MINAAWESRTWQLDMQLVGKVALSATAFFLLALAYRFYKLRTSESSDLTGKHGPGPTREDSGIADAPQRDYINTGTGNLRFRCVNSNLQDSLVTDPGSKHLADVSASTHRPHVKAQEEFETGDAISRDQSGFARGDSAELHNTVDLLQSPRAPGDDADCRHDECDGEGTFNKRDSKSYRQDPEGREMFERLELQRELGVRPTRNISAISSVDLSLSHVNESKHELHTFSSVAEVQMQENILSEDGNSPQPLMPGGLRGKVYHYHVESTSQSLTAEKTCDPRVLHPQLPLTHIKNYFLSSEEDGEEEKSLIHQEETTDGDVIGRKSPEQINPSPKQDIARGSDDQEEGVKTNAETEGIGPNDTPLVTASTYLAGQSSDAAVDTQSGPDTYHISLPPDSMFDIHLNLDNCYEVLCLAKRHKLDTLKAATYKMMSKDYLQVLQNPSIFGLLNVTERDLILESRMKGRRFVAVADIDTQAATATQNESSLSYYDSDKDRWHPLTHIPIEAVSRGCTMATMFNYLFVVLGCDGPGRQMNPSKRVLCYNPLTDSWKEVSSLNEGRPHCKLVALDGYLYAIGGECLHTVERYDPRQNKWSYVTPLPNDTFAVAHMATAYDDEIFVTGGTIRYLLLRYRHRDNAWKSSLVSGSKDRTTEMVAANNFLYRFDLNRSMGISVHRCNIRARIWYECANYAMPYPAPFHCVVVDNSIYCISRNFHLRFLTDDISPRFIDLDLQPVPSPKGLLFPFALVLPVKDTH
ncbi:kelch domain-containing protein 7A [Pseudophryne corroboree]|uniref:kelch domain-containing protein 7A n=1 Tax=Pseudophryne corroboree TaxID=495146 RepID=UPI003081C4FE